MLREENHNVQEYRTSFTTTAAKCYSLFKIERKLNKPQSDSSLICKADNVEQNPTSTRPGIMFLTHLVYAVLRTSYFPPNCLVKKLKSRTLQTNESLITSKVFEKLLYRL